MIIDTNTRKGYLLHTFSNGKTALCKVLNEYNQSEQAEAQKDLLKLVTAESKDAEVTEKNLLSKYSKKNTL
jgi:hypothetical protein